MRRDLRGLTNQTLDVLVAGGGVTGACVAWDAALRGLTVALVDRADFANATSWNTLKIIHGGLRHLQRLDLRQVRHSAEERSTWLRIAPHLVEPLPVLVPSYRRGLQNRFLLRTAAGLSEVLAWNTNRGLDCDRCVPAGRIVSRRECLDLVPEYEATPVTGGLLYHDAVMYSSERLVLEVVEAASRAGAATVNYARLVEACDVRPDAVTGLIEDTLSGDRLHARARVIVNATGSAVTNLAGRLTGRGRESAHALALNVMIPSQGHRVAFALPSFERDPDARLGLGRRQFFFVPWRDRLIVGTGQWPHHEDPDNLVIPQERVREFLDAVNAAWRGTPFDCEDVVVVHAGLVPAIQRSAPSPLQLLRRGRVHDHAADNAPWLVSVETPKLTMARRVAEHATDLVVKKLGRNDPGGGTVSTPLPGAPAGGFANLLAAAMERYGNLLECDVLEHLVRTYGEQFEQVLACRSHVAGWDDRIIDSAPVIKAQWVHAVREEAARRPEDLVYRRTELGARGLADEGVMALARETLELSEARAT